MAKLSVELKDEYASAEDREVDGENVGQIRRGSANIKYGGKTVAHLRTIIAIPSDPDDYPQLALGIYPTDAEGHGYVAGKELEVEGPVAVALAELLRLALPYLRGPKPTDSIGSKLITTKWFDSKKDEDDDD